MKRIVHSDCGCGVDRKTGQFVSYCAACVARIRGRRAVERAGIGKTARQRAAAYARLHPVTLAARLPGQFPAVAAAQAEFDAELDALRLRLQQPSEAGRSAQSVLAATG